MLIKEAAMQDSQVTAVLTGDLDLLRCFRGTGIVTFVASGDRDNVVFYSRECRRAKLLANMDSDPEQFVADLVEVGRRFRQRPLLYYNSDAVLLLISRNREQLSECYRFRMPPSEVIEALVDKTKFAGLAADLALPVPTTLRSTEVQSADAALKSMPLPCIFKPDSRHLGWDHSELIREQGGKPQKMLRADTAGEFARLHSKMRQLTNNFVIQQYIFGGDDHIYSFHAYLNEHSEPLAYFVGRKIRTFPKDCGVSTFLELVKDPEVIHLGLRILRQLNFVGPVKLDFKKDARSGHFYLLEINPRFTLWNHLGVACGISIPLAAYADLMGQPTSLQTEYRTGIRWLQLGTDFRSFVRDYHRDGDLSWTEYLKSLRGPKIYPIFDWRDPLPMAVTLWRQVRIRAHRLGAWLRFDSANGRSAGGSSR